MPPNEITLSRDITFDDSNVLAKDLEENLLQLTLREGRERSFSLKLNDELLHALCVMLRAANENAGWDLTLEYTTPPTLVGSPAKALLH